MKAPSTKTKQLSNTAHRSLIACARACNMLAMLSVLALTSKYSNSCAIARSARQNRNETTTEVNAYGPTRVTYFVVHHAVRIIIALAAHKQVKRFLEGVTAGDTQQFNNSAILEVQQACQGELKPLSACQIKHLQVGESRGSRKQQHHDVPPQR